MNKAGWLAMFLFIPLLGTSQSLGLFDKAADIGHPKIAGTTVYDPGKASYTIAGGGYNIWFARDEFQYCYKALSGDFVLTGHFAFIGEGADPHRKTGWMLRPTLSDSGQHISAVLHGDGLTVLQWRLKDGMSMRDPEDERFANSDHYPILQLERKGTLFIMRAAKSSGETMEEIGRVEMPDYPPTIYAGIFLCSHNPEIKESAEVNHVVIE